MTSALFARDAHLHHEESALFLALLPASFRVGQGEEKAVSAALNVVNLMP